MSCSGAKTKPTRSLTAFYVLVYLIIFLLFSYPPYKDLSSAGTLSGRSLSSSIVLLVLLAVVLAVSRFAHQGPLPRITGFRREGILRSFVWANAFLFPIMIILLGMLVVSGPNSLLSISEIPLPSQVPGWYPLFAYMPLLLGGFAFFPLLQAFPYESLKDVPKRYVIPLVAVISASIYNDAFLTGVLRWDDIIFFGFLFTVAYHESRNSIGLALAYALAESGVWYVVALTWGVTVFEAALLARVALSATSVAVLVFWYLGRRNATTSVQTVT